VKYHYLLLVGLLIGCGAPKKSNKVATINSAYYSAEHSLEIDYKDVSKSAQDINDFARSIQKKLVEVKYEELHFTNFDKNTELNFAMNPIREQSAIDRIDELLITVEEKLLSTQDQDQILDLELLKDFLTNHQEFNAAAVKNNYINL